MWRTQCREGAGDVNNNWVTSVIFTMLQSPVSSRLIISRLWKLNADISKFRLRTIKMFQNKLLKSALYISLVTKMKLMSDRCENYG